MRWTSTEQSKLFSNSTDWLVGVYASQLQEYNKRTERVTYPGPSVYNTDAESDFTHNKLAFYSQLDQAITEKKTLIYSLRIEHHQQNFKLDTVKTGDSPGTFNDKFSPSETLWGGSIHYHHRYNQTHTAFAGITRGYKAGGFNAGLPTTDNVKYQNETLLSYETGLKSNFNNKLKTTTTVFYMDRQNPQFDGYSYDPATQAEWVFFTENLNSAQHYGLETEVNWQANSRWNLFANLGLLQTEVKGSPINSEFTMSDRGAPHAPSYQYLVGTQYRHDQGWFGRVEVQGMDSFYFDNVHNQKSETYTLANARIGYEAQDWEIYLWGKNLTDEKYATRGYFFDHFDGDGEQLYIALGDPRQIGLTTRVRF